MIIGYLDPWGFEVWDLDFGCPKPRLNFLALIS